MTHENYTDYQYNRCSSRGICSINPVTAALQEVMLIHLKYAASFWIKANEKGIKNQNIRNLVLNTLSVLSSNYEISKVNFYMINSAFKKELLNIKNELDKIYPPEEIPEINIVCETDEDLKDYIRYGEKELNKKLVKLSSEKRNLYEILFIVIKSICINVLIYEGFGENAEIEVLSIFKALNLLNKTDIKKEEITNFISDISEKDCKLMKKIREIQEKHYGEQDETQISFSTQKGKAILVVGSDLRELEYILNIFNNEKIDVYTHDNMVLAHTFPKFREYKNLKGQFGQGIENCLLDFSTFPGPIILTRHSLFNIESLYRGRLFTTDYSYSKGVISVKNNDFSQVIKSAEESRGFKTGKICETENAGFSFVKIIEKIKNKLENKKYNQIILFGISGYSAEEKEYFKTFIKHAPQDILIVSLFCCEQEENVICTNAMNDIYAMNRLFDKIQKSFSQKITIFFPISDRHTLSVIINSAKNKNIKIYIGKWNQTIIKPDVLEGLKSEFGIYEITSPKNELKNITDIK